MEQLTSKRVFEKEGVPYKMVKNENGKHWADRTFNKAPRKQYTQGELITMGWVEKINRNSLK